MKTTVQTCLERALEEIKSKCGRAFPEIMQWTPEDVEEVAGKLDEDYYEDEPEDVILEAARDNVRQLEMNYLSEYATRIFNASDLDSDVGDWAYATYLDEYQSEDELKKELSEAAWQQADFESEKRTDRLADIACDILKDETGIDYPPIEFLFKNRKKDIIEALQLDSLDEYYISGLMPDEVGEKPQFPYSYPDEAEIIKDIKAQIEVFDFVKFTNDLFDKYED